MDGSSKHVNSCNSGVNAIVGPYYFTEQNRPERTKTPHYFTERNRRYSVLQSYTVQCALTKYQVSNAFGPRFYWSPRPSNSSSILLKELPSSLPPVGEI